MDPLVLSGAACILSLIRTNDIYRKGRSIRRRYTKKTAKSLVFELWFYIRSTCCFHYLSHWRAEKKTIKYGGRLKE